MAQGSVIEVDGLSDGRVLVGAIETRAVIFQEEMSSLRRALFRKFINELSYRLAGSPDPPVKRLCEESREE